MDTTERFRRQHVPANWTDTSTADRLEFTHRPSGLRIVAERSERATAAPPADTVGCWEIRCRTRAGEATCSRRFDRATTERAALERISTVMEAVNRVADRRDRGETVTLGAALADLEDERPNPGKGIRSTSGGFERADGRERTERNTGQDGHNRVEYDMRTQHDGSGQRNSKRRSTGTDDRSRVGPSGHRTRGGLRGEH